MMRVYYTDMRMLLLLACLPALAQVHVESCGPADTGYSGGTCYTSPVALPPGAPAYLQRERYGNFSYHFALPDGQYTVTLHMIENSTAITGPGQRIFSASANGAAIVTALDLYATAGYNVPVDHSAPVTATTGAGITIIFTTQVRNAVVSAIDIAPASGASCAHLISKAPIGALLIFRNGILQRETADYIVSGNLISPNAWGNGDLMTAYAQWREDWQCTGSQGTTAQLLLRTDPIVVPGLQHARNSAGLEFYLVDWPALHVIK